MKDKHEYMKRFNVDDKRNIAQTLAVFGGFTEGLQPISMLDAVSRYARFLWRENSPVALKARLIQPSLYLVSLIYS